MVSGGRDPRAVLSEVMDPEIPALSIADLGILRGVEASDDRVVVTITPTYSGCPAMDAIRADIVTALAGAGYTAEVRTELSPPWTTDDVSEEGRRRLASIGIAPPGPMETVRCPRCASSTHMISEFGSTGCKALMVCDTCREPFDLFKELR
jgi:ring-1,2-phenylacetyl-CoA epoxidase subunit PaaD